MWCRPAGLPTGEDDRPPHPRPSPNWAQDHRTVQHSIVCVRCVWWDWHWAVRVGRIRESLQCVRLQDVGRLPVCCFRSTRIDARERGSAADIVEVLRYQPEGPVAVRTMHREDTSHKHHELHRMVSYRGFAVIPSVTSSNSQFAPVT